MKEAKSRWNRRVFFQIYWPPNTISYSLFTCYGQLENIQTKSDVFWITICQFSCKENVRSSSINDLIEVCCQDDVLLIYQMILYWSCWKRVCTSHFEHLYTVAYDPFCTGLSVITALVILLIYVGCYVLRYLIENLFALQNNHFFNFYMFMHLYVTHVCSVLRFELQHLSTCICILLFFNEKSCMFHFLWG